ncbi:MAG: site-specific integrase [Holophaga sp.]|nr:site-specific integrase [Holophaga sp.]
MARSARDSRIESRTARAKLISRKSPYRVRLEPGQALGYYKPTGGAGSWIAFLNPGKEDEGGVGWKQKAVGTADDFIEPDGAAVLSYAQAQAKAREWFSLCADDAARALSGMPVPKGPYTVDSALDDYMEDAKRRGMKGLEQTRCAINAHLRPELGPLEVAKLSRERIEGWLKKLAESPKRKRQPNPATKSHKKKAAEDEPKPVKPALPMTEDEKRARKDSANRVLTVLKAALNHALDRGRVKHGEAWKAVKPYRGTTSARLRFLTPEEQVRLVNVCPPDFRRLVMAALHTGARYGELGGLRVRDFNPGAGTLWIEPRKTEKGRHVVLTDEGQAFFAGLTAGAEAEALMLTREGIKRRGRKGMAGAEGWAGNDQKWLMEDARKAAGLGALSFHELRHTYASGLVNKGVPLAFVAELLGHTDIRMVSKHYGHLAPNALADAVRTLAPKLGLGDAPKVAGLKIAGA